MYQKVSHTFGRENKTPRQKTGRLKSDQTKILAD